ncbi:MAG: hypothetical protein AAF483_06840 [Planctomycetota bacterium]
MNRSNIASCEELLALSIERHGGFNAFENVSKIILQLHELSGMIPWAKGIARTFEMPPRIAIEPHQLRASLLYKDATITFDQGTMKQDGEEHAQYRRSFAGFRKLRRWSNIDAGYFFGYALVNYLRLPFMLAELPIRKYRIGHGLSWVEFEFPNGADTHSRIQRFWFDSSGLLVRHDYRADILGPIFYGAHFSGHYRFDLPIPIAEDRQVAMRLGSWSTSLVALKARFTVESAE